MPPITSLLYLKLVLQLLLANVVLFLVGFDRLIKRQIIVDLYSDVRLIQATSQVVDVQVDKSSILCF